MFHEPTRNMCLECPTVLAFGSDGPAAESKSAEADRAATSRPLLNFFESQLERWVLGRSAYLIVLVALLQTQLSRCLLCLWAFDSMAVCCSAAMAASRSPKARRGFILEVFEILENKELVCIFFLLSYLLISPFLVPPLYLTAPAATFIAFSMDEDMPHNQVQRFRSLFQASSFLREKGPRETKKC